MVALTSEQKNLIKNANAMRIYDLISDTNFSKNSYAYYNYLCAELKFVGVPEERKRIEINKYLTRLADASMINMSLAEIEYFPDIEHLPGDSRKMWARIFEAKMTRQMRRYRERFGGMPQ